MKATELMIGDWVCFDGDVEHTNPVQIDIVSQEEAGVDGDYYDRWLPIPLTAEILEKNFPKPRGEYWADGDFPQIGYSIPCHTDGHLPYVEVSIYDPARVMEFEMYLNYVHELQHAMRLCGIEKEIEI